MRVRGAATLCVALTMLAIVTSAVAAPGGAIREKRSQAIAAKAAYDRLGAALEPAIQRYDTAVYELGVVEERIALNQHRIEQVRIGVERSRAALAEQVVGAYRNGDLDIAAQLMSAGSFTEILDTVEYLERAQTRQSELVADVVAAQKELAERRQQLRSDQAAAEQLVSRREAERASIADGMARQQAAIRGLEAEIAQLKREEAARQRRLAAEAAHRVEAARIAAAAAAALAAPEPLIGGSGPSDGAQNIATVPAPAPSDGSLGARAVAYALRYLGTPYSWGGGTASGPSRGIAQGAGTVGFDCSGLTLYAWAQVGVSLSHFTGSQWQQGSHINSMGDLVPGDLVFFGSDLGHMGMYIGGGQMVHAPHTGDVVKISNISSGYYASSFRGGVRPA